MNENLLESQEPVKMQVLSQSLLGSESLPSVNWLSGNEMGCYTQRTFFPLISLPREKDFPKDIRIV